MQKVAIRQVQLDAWRSLLVAHAALIDRLGEEMEAETDLPLTWYEVLLLLNQSQDLQLRMHELAESRLLSRSAMTRFIDRMENAGLVCRVTCDSDRRGTFVTMTELGRERFRAAAAVHLRGIETHFASYVMDAQAEVLATTMNGIVTALNESHASLEGPEA